MTTSGERVRDLFLAAIELPQAARDAFLQEACDDDSLRERVRLLLTHDTAAAEERFLSTGGLRAIGDRIGPYVVRDLLGIGGMGAVYLAQQEEPIRREVALKVIKLGMDSAQVIARFDSERQALALMDHPGIAHIYDAGTTPRGQPYFAMEYIDGRAVTVYCEERQLPLTERVELFLQVCDAVEHAHQKGVVHRDLKPSNILVSDADAPMPKVIDFGLALATGPSDLRREFQTAVDHPLGTPEYMSPEQTAGGSQAVDTRSDIYSLGVVLYELVARKHPTPGIEGASDDEIRRRIREAPPQRPSAAARGVRPELDWILLRTLEKEPDRRYQAVGELAADLQRLLAHEPIAAGPPSTLYRLRKFARRHLAPAIALIVVSIAIFGALIGTSLAWVEAAERENDTRVALGRFQLLANSVRLSRARINAQALRLQDLDSIAEMRAWLDEQAAPLVARLPEAEKLLVELQEGALPYDESIRQRDLARHPAKRQQLFEWRQLRDEWRASGDEPDKLGQIEERIARLEADLESRRTMTLDGDVNQLLHDSLNQFVAELRAFTDPTYGDVAAIQDRLDWAERVVDETINVHRARWDETTAAIALDPDYGGLQLSPQIGLVPIGRDPESGRFEFAHPRSGAIAERDSTTDRLVITPETGLVFVLIPTGEFWMGAQCDDENGRNYDPRATVAESPVHEIEIKAFFMSKYEMTQAQWLRLNRGPNPSTHTPAFDGRPEITLTHPVENVSWLDCTELLREHGLALPTEAQWEYSCLDEVASKTDEKALHAPVDSLAPNSHGLHHMLGNVAEWCRDWFESYRVPVQGCDGLRQSIGTHGLRSVRGNSRPTQRGYDRPDSRSGTTGLRPARRLDDR